MRKPYSRLRYRHSWTPSPRTGENLSADPTAQATPRTSDRFVFSDFLRPRWKVKARDLIVRVPGPAEVSICVRSRTTRVLSNAARRPVLGGAAPSRATAHNRTISIDERSCAVRPVPERAAANPSAVTLGVAALCSFPPARPRYRPDQEPAEDERKSAWEHRRGRTPAAYIGAVDGFK